MSSCLHCGVPISRVAGRRGPLPKYCSARCRNRAKWLQQKAANPCPKCGSPMSRSSSSSADDQQCRKCRFGERRHGTSQMYDREKCRCRECKNWKAAQQRRYAARRKAEGRPLYTVESRRTVAASCEQCGISFLGVSSKPNRFCSMECAIDARPKSDAPRFKIARSVRLSIYMAAKWSCELCGCPTRPDEDYNHPRYPTLDHIQPRSLGGSDDPENLRLACRQCNTLRGNNVDWVPELVEVA